MIKAMLVVASLGINTEMPNMKTCLEAREQLLEQDKKIQVLCVPSNPKPDRRSEMKEMFSLFLNMIQLFVVQIMPGCSCPHAFHTQTDCHFRA